MSREEKVTVVVSQMQNRLSAFCMRLKKVAIIVQHKPIHFETDVERLKTILARPNIKTLVKWVLDGRTDMDIHDDYVEYSIQLYFTCHFATCTIL